MKPQGTRSTSRGTQKEFPLKDITSRIIKGNRQKSGVADEFLCGTAKGRYKKVHQLREHREEKESGLFNSLILKNISVNSVVNFLTIPEEQAG